MLADRELEPLAVVLAWAISNSVDSAAADSWFSRAELARLVAAPGQAVAIAIDQLASRGHVETKGTRGGRRYRARLLGDQALAPRVAAIVTPFPVARRCAFIRKHAARMTAMSVAQADAHLHQQTRVQADTMRRRGISESEIAREIRNLECAIRTELWRLILTPEGPAS